LPFDSHEPAFFQMKGLDVCEVHQTAFIDQPCTGASKPFFLSVGARVANLFHDD
jgi:hypothetical protein